MSRELAFLFEPEDWNTPQIFNNIFEEASVPLKDSDNISLYIGHRILTPEGEIEFINLLHEIVNKNINYNIHFLKGEPQKKATELLYKTYPPPALNNVPMKYVREAYIPTWESWFYSCKYNHFYTYVFILDYNFLTEKYKWDPPKKGFRFKLYLSDADDTEMEYYSDELNSLMEAFDILTSDNLKLRDSLNLYSDELSIFNVT
jgi:hypothetical protein